jgi:hypothetical protein
VHGGRARGSQSESCSTAAGFGLAEEVGQDMTLSRWHIVGILVLVLLLFAGLVVGEVGRNGAVTNQAGAGQPGSSLNAVKNIVTIVGVIIAAGSLALTAQNTDLTRRTGRARFWLDLRDQFEKHDAVHLRLRPGGDWAGARGGPSTVDEWAKVEAYMGLFEHCEIMLDQKLIDESTFEEIYKYRLGNIVANDIIRREKLCKRPGGWERFLNLADRMRIEVKC